MIIAIDFDGTCVTHEYPAIGKDIGAIPILKRIVSDGHKLILWTMRSNNRSDGTNPLHDAVDWFNNNNIPLFGINENPEQHKWTSSPKVYAHIYIDDAALGIPLCQGLAEERPYVNWEAINNILYGSAQKEIVTCL